MVIFVDGMGGLGKLVKNEQCWSARRENVDMSIWLTQLKSCS